MGSDAASIYADRSAAGLARMFHLFGRNEAPGLESPLYAELSYGIALDPELLAIGAHVPATQPPPNNLFAAVQYLLLSGAQHELAAHYPAISGKARPLAPAFPAFRDFCRVHRREIEELVATRRTQTNVVRRCACLLPAFATIAAREERPLALVEIGSSAGLNLNWDRYRYVYRRGGRDEVLWGDPSSRLTIAPKLRGGESLPELPARIDAPWRTGIDTDPIDVEDADAVTWLRALIWPEHVDRHAELAGAIGIARRHPPRSERGDAVERAADVVASAPRDAAPVVFATFALYQIPRARIATMLSRLERECASRERPLWLVTMEPSAHGETELVRVRLDGATREVARLASCSPHGWWLAWEGEATDAATRARIAAWWPRES